MQHVISSLIGDEQTLLRCVTNFTDRYPSTANLSSLPSPESGTQLLHWAVETCSSSKLLELLLGVKCSLGLIPECAPNGELRHDQPSSLQTSHVGHDFGRHFGHHFGHHF